MKAVFPLQGVCCSSGASELCIFGGEGKIIQVAKKAEECDL